MEEEQTLIHDNRGRPFKAIIGSSSVEVKKKHCTKEDPEGEYIDFKKWDNGNVEKIWVGVDTCDREWSKGNSVLFRTSKNEYVMIGSVIYSFSSLHEIVEFHSAVGRNDVPYPWALDSENNAYLLLLDWRSVVQCFPVSNEMKEKFDDSATSDLIYGEGKEHFKDKKKASTDPYKELWFNKTIPADSVQKIKATIIHERLFC
jgi:hypothetical protein